VGSARGRVLLLGVLRGALGVGLAALLAGLQVGADLVGLVLGLAVARVDEVLRGVAATEPEGQRGAQGDRADQGDVGGVDDGLGDRARAPP
jgi:hypothetical protein